MQKQGELAGHGLPGNLQLLRLSLKDRLLGISARTESIGEALLSSTPPVQPSAARAHSDALRHWQHIQDHSNTGAWCLTLSLANDPHHRCDSQS
jgi:hypothetical protein